MNMPEVNTDEDGFSGLNNRPDSAENRTSEI